MNRWGISPYTDPNFPQRFLEARGIARENAVIFADLFQRGEFPNPLNLDSKTGFLIQLLGFHYRYGWKKWVGQ